MRIRRKPWAVPELEACGFFIKTPGEHRGAWKKAFSKNQPLHLELGCGKGGFISQIAVKNPEINYIAVDIKSEMLGLAKRNVEREFGKGNFPQNVLLTSYDVERLSDIFSENDRVERIYINFCNPWPKAKHNKHRLTHTKQLMTYRNFLVDGGEIRFKTDDDGLFLSSQRYFKEAGFDITYITHDLHAEKRPDNILTEHERMFSSDGIKIKYLTARKEEYDERNSYI